MYTCPPSCSDKVHKDVAARILCLSPVLGNSSQPPFWVESDALTIVHLGQVGTCVTRVLYSDQRLPSTECITLRCLCVLRDIDRSTTN